VIAFSPGHGAIIHLAVHGACRYTSDILRIIVAHA
jgi:hypothetical protein